MTGPLSKAVAARHGRVARGELSGRGVEARMPQHSVLEQFRDAVLAWKREGEQRWTDARGVFHLCLGPHHYRALELLDLIDRANEQTALANLIEGTKPAEGPWPW